MFLAEDVRTADPSGGLEGHQELRFAFLAADPGEARFEDPATEELLDDVVYHRPPGA